MAELRAALTLRPVPALASAGSHPHRFLSQQRGAPAALGAGPRKNCSEHTACRHSQVGPLRLPKVREGQPLGSITGWRPGSDPDPRSPKGGARRFWEDRGRSQIPQQHPPPQRTLCGQAGCGLCPTGPRPTHRVQGPERQPCPQLAATPGTLTPRLQPGPSARVSTCQHLHTGRNSRVSCLESLSRGRGTSKGPPQSAHGARHPGHLAPAGQCPPHQVRAVLILGTEVAWVPPEELVLGPARLSAGEKPHRQVPTARTTHQHELDGGQELLASGCPMATRTLGPWLTCSQGLQGCPPGRDRVTLGKLYPRPEQTRTSTRLSPGTATARAGISTRSPAGLPSRAGACRGLTWSPALRRSAVPHLACGGLTYRSALLGTVALGHVRSDLFSDEPPAPGSMWSAPKRFPVTTMTRTTSLSSSEARARRSDSGPAGMFRRECPHPWLAEGRGGRRPARPWATRHRATWLRRPGRRAAHLDGPLQLRLPVAEPQHPGDGQGHAEPVEEAEEVDDGEDVSGEGVQQRHDALRAERGGAGTQAHAEGAAPRGHPLPARAQPAPTPRLHRPPHRSHAFWFATTMRSFWN